MFSCHSNRVVDKYQNHVIDRDYYDNGKIMYETMYLNGKIDGFTMSWNKKGNLISKVQYKDGTLNGVWETYYESGVIKNSAVYLNNKKHGMEIWFHGNGCR